MKITCSKCRSSFQVPPAREALPDLTCPYCGESVRDDIESDFSVHDPAAPDDADSDSGMVDQDSVLPDRVIDGSEGNETESDDGADFPDGWAESRIDQPARPLGVRLVALTMGILGLLTAFWLTLNLMRGVFTAADLTPAYIAIGLSLFVALVMFRLYQYRESARKVTIAICLVSLLISGKTIVEIVSFARQVPWGILVNYCLRFLFCLYFMFYLMTPRVKAAFSGRSLVDASSNS